MDIPIRSRWYQPAICERPCLPASKNGPLGRAKRIRRLGFSASYLQCQRAETWRPDKAINAQTSIACKLENWSASDWNHAFIGCVGAAHAQRHQSAANVFASGNELESSPYVAFLVKLSFWTPAVRLNACPTYILQWLCGANCGKLPQVIQHHLGTTCCCSTRHCVLQHKASCQGTSRSADNILDSGAMTLSLVSSSEQKINMACPLRNVQSCWKSFTGFEPTTPIIKRAFPKKKK